MPEFISSSKQEKKFSDPQKEILPEGKHLEELDQTLGAARDIIEKYRKGDLTIEETHKRLVRILNNTLRALDLSKAAVPHSKEA